MKQRDDWQFVFLKRMPEAVVERCAERLVAALPFVGVLDLLLAAADGFDKILNLLPPAQTRFDRLPNQHTQGQRIAGAVIQQRLPVSNLRALQVSLFTELQ